jgi:hypothetical protein
VHFLWVLLLLGIFQGNVTSQSPPAVVSGTIVKQGTGEPISKAVVTLSTAGPVLNGPIPIGAIPTGPVPIELSTTTNTDGKFIFDNVPAGRYRISSTRNGYARAEYGSRGANGCGDVMVLMDGQRMTNVQVSMIPSGAISGRLRDQDGDPAANTVVNALKYTYQNGKRTLTVVETTRTNDIGEYRLFGLPPGRYYIGAALPTPVPQAAIAADNAPLYVPFRPATGALPVRAGPIAEQTAVLQFLPVYYPGTPDPQNASPIDLRAGETFLRGDMSVTLSRTRRVRGRIVNRVAIEVPRSFTIFLVSRVADPGAGNPLRVAPMMRDGLL